jgi:glycosyltransferase involved in cell wall biosynthesis
MAEFSIGPEAGPLVSIITATYNRSNVLRYAIESVLRQTFTRWELWVVGDACTDDTAEVVGAFADPRIHFVNLDQNVGDQSGPNNEGFRRSRGRFIAYLNHDDLWLPDHLETALAALEETGADLVWSLVVARRSDDAYVCNDLNPERRYAPHLVVPVSFWVLRRELVEEIGPWRGHWECHAAPSQDWLFRASCAGKDLRYISQLTAIALPSGGRPGAYAQREFLENQAVFEQMGQPGFRENVLLAVAEQYAIAQSNPPVWGEVRHTLRDLVRRRLAPYWGWARPSQYVSPLSIALRKKVSRLLGTCGLHPQAVEFFLQYRRRGGFIYFLRRFRGLPEKPDAAVRVERAAAGEARK